MTEAITFAPGNYRYVPGVFQYSAGVAAMPGFRLLRVSFARPVPLADGFAAAERAMRAAGRPTTAFAACELRSPAPFTEAGFRAFNEQYVGTLARWGIYHSGANPVARSNVCPAIDPPAEPSFHAFAFTVPDEAAGPSFIVAGSGEAPEGKGNYRDHIVRLGDTSPAAMVEKARFVLGEMERRMAVLGFGWADTTATQLYTVHDVHPFLAAEIVRRGAARAGLTWHYCRPPVVDLEYEMDCRAVFEERVMAG
ncbi:MAG: hypothetical protein IT557_07405 [Alphaproteobacteria bacterium]|nr:hypothetical protein [Alphaproteobacteria bacterium]